MIRRWVKHWRDAAPELEEIRRREVRAADNLRVLELLEPAFNHATRSLPPRVSSGMTEMQAILARLRR